MGEINKLKTVCPRCMRTIPKGAKECPNCGFCVNCENGDIHE